MPKGQYERKLRGSYKTAKARPSLSNLTDFELGWLVGMLEGEGCFTVQRSNALAYAVVSVCSTDRDTIEYAATLLDNSKIYTTSKNRKKPLHSIKIVGEPAERIMQELLVYMSLRRCARIEEVLEETRTRRHTHATIV